MRKWTGLAATVVFGVTVAAVHLAVTWTFMIGIAFMAVSTERPRISPTAVELVVRLFTFPVAWLPVGEPSLMFALNSALWGLALALVARWFWNRRMPRVAT